MKPWVNKVFYRWHIKVLSFAAAGFLFLLFRMNTLEERIFTAPLQIMLNDEYIISEEHAQSVRITIRGEAEGLNSILEEDIAPYIDMTDHPGEGSFVEPILVRKKGTALNMESLEIRVEPREMVLSQEEKVTMSLTVKPRIVGFVSLGYSLSQYYVSPTSVSAIGPRSQMDGLKSVVTEAIDISGQYSDFSVFSRIVNPQPLVSFPGGSSVQFRGVVEENIIEKSIPNLSIALLDLSDSFVRTSDLPKVSITVQGKQARLEKLRQQDLSFTIDCSRIYRPGTYNFKVQTDLPEDLVVLKLVPREVDINFGYASEVTP